MVSPSLSAGKRADYGVRFGAAAEEYDRIRPGYPDATVDWCTAGLEPGECIDVGTGTGRFAAALLARGWSVLGVDPDPDLLALHPAPTALGRAESLPLEPASADLITVAQAWHWVDEAEAAAEFSRVLRQGGRAAVIVNQLDVRVDWVMRLARIMHAGDVYRPAWRPRLAGFGEVEGHVEEFSTPVGVDDVVALAATRTYWLRSPERVRARVEGNIREFLAGEGRELAGSAVGDDGRFALPYLCLSYRAQRTG